MAPSKQKIAAETIAKRRIVTRSMKKPSSSNNNNNLKSSKLNIKEEERKNSSWSSSATTMIATNDVCSTPKSAKYKIPEISTCPPAPKKPKNSRRLFGKTRPINFFAHPDLEKLFVFSMKDIKV